ncbi:unnamed protein product [Candidula unifasciata]|uniref:Uncharacterized protein n=1 Tax=Candidula unifasciata TaxID=100452 RepID=A0A8S4A3F1_9EUPU|nr:unnamed protein product [Candidula unifasciata]
MQNYQQFLALPTFHQLPPLASPAHPQPIASSVLAFGETQLGGGGFHGGCSLPATGFVSVKPPTSLVYQIHPRNYTYGFNSSGKLIGANPEIPYPGSGAKFHDVPFSRSVDWYASDLIGNSNIKEEAPEKPSETDEYFTAANDEGYKQWIEKKKEEQQKQNEKQKQIRTVPVEIKALPGHVNPSVTETSNERYGQYLDLRPKYPAVYPLPAKVPPMPMQVLVKFRHSNISGHPPIPDHSFAVDPREMITKEGCYTRGIHGSVFYPEVSNPNTKTAFTFRPNQTILGQTVGERQKGFTWPLYAPTGLELNRPIPQCVSVVVGVNGKKKFRTMIPPRAVPYIYNRYMSYTGIPSDDPETELNPAKQHKQICIPFTPVSVSNPVCDPCNLKFINPQLLPLPLELKKPPSC